MVEWSIFNEIFAVAFNVLYFVIIIGTIFIVILDNRNPVKTMAWVLVLFFLPIVGLVFYFFFGRSTRKEKLISKKGFTRLIKRPMAEYQAQKAFKCPDEQHQLMRFFRKVNNALPFEGNATEVFTDGYSMLYSLMKEISKAKHHIHLQFYIFEDDPAGRLLRDLLIDKARQGVEVRLLYDDVGCWKVPHAFFDEMRGAGIEARSFLKVRFPLFTSKVNYRNHRKIVVIDGRVAYTGGMNIALRYMKGFPWGIWRDTHIKIEGKAVYGLQTAFFDRLVCSRPYPYHFLPLFPRSRNLWKGSDTDCYFRSCRRMAGYYARATDSYQQLPKVFLYTNTLPVAYRTYSDGIENGSFGRRGCSHYDTGTCRYMDNTFRFVILFG